MNVSSKVKVVASNVTNVKTKTSDVPNDLKTPKALKISKVPKKATNKITKFNNKTNFKKVDYVAWQKSLIIQFGSSLPDSQLRLKTLPTDNDGHCPKN